MENSTKTKIDKTKKVLLMGKLENLKAAKSNANFQNKIRSFFVALQDKEKILNSNLVWAERFVKTSTKLKVKIKTLEISDPANFQRTEKLFKSVLESDLVQSKEFAEARKETDILKCENETQRKIVSEYYDVKIMAEIRLKESIKSVLLSEGMTEEKEAEIAA